MSINKAVHDHLIKTVINKYGQCEHVFHDIDNHAKSMSLPSTYVYYTNYESHPSLRQPHQDRIEITYRPHIWILNTYAVRVSDRVLIDPNKSNALAHVIELVAEIIDNWYLFNIMGQSEKFNLYFFQPSGRKIVTKFHHEWDVEIRYGMCRIARLPPLPLNSSNAFAQVLVALKRYKYWLDLGVGPDAAMRNVGDHLNQQLLATKHSELWCGCFSDY